jgi:hypothetical protein
MFVAVLGVIIERNVLAFLLELEICCGCETLGQSGLAIELMRKATRFEHGLCVNAGGLRKACIHDERRRSGLPARLIRQDQQLLFDLKVIGFEGDVGCIRGGFENSRIAGLSRGRGQEPSG